MKEQAKSADVVETLLKKRQMPGAHRIPRAHLSPVDANIDAAARGPHREPDWSADPSLLPKAPPGRGR